jgi:hypothetical protein
MAQGFGFGFQYCPPEGGQSKHEQAARMVGELKELRKGGWTIAEQAGLYDAVVALEKEANAWRERIIAGWEGE